MVTAETTLQETIPSAAIDPSILVLFMVVLLLNVSKEYESAFCIRPQTHPSVQPCTEIDSQANLNALAVKVIDLFQLKKFQRNSLYFGRLR
jgi:hypothetical protein